LPHNRLSVKFVVNTIKELRVKMSVWIVTVKVIDRAKSDYA